MDEDVIEVSIVTKLNSVSAAICNADRLIADINVSGLFSWRYFYFINVLVHDDNTSDHARVIE